jgi:hypothetical protein
MCSRICPVDPAPEFRYNKAHWGDGGMAYTEVLKTSTFGYVGSTPTRLIKSILVGAFFVIQHPRSLFRPLCQTARPHQP